MRLSNYLAVPALLVLATQALAEGPVRYVQAPSGSSLNFTFTQLDAESTGRFKSFATEFLYDEKNPAAGSLEVTIEIGSLDTQDGERDEALKGTDLFGVATWPRATFVSRSMTKNTAGGIDVLGRLTLRGVTKDLRLPIALKPTASGLELSGQTSLKRLDFGVGQGEWQSTESVGDEVKVSYKVVLVRAK
jgi:polyisoprenoid-binding protein YceI